MEARSLSGEGEAGTAPHSPLTDCESKALRGRRVDLCSYFIGLVECQILCCGVHWRT